MFHWICPECGREIAPTVRECPACDGAEQAELVLAGVVEASARTLNVEASARSVNAEVSKNSASAEAPAVHTKPEAPEVPASVHDSVSGVENSAENNGVHQGAEASAFPDAATEPLVAAEVAAMPTPEVGALRRMETSAETNNESHDETRAGDNGSLQLLTALVESGAVSAGSQDLEARLDAAAKAIAEAPQNPPIPEPERLLIPEIVDPATEMSRFMETRTAALFGARNREPRQKFRSIRTKMVESRMVDTRSMDAKSMEGRSLETKSAETKPTDTRPIETKLIETKLIDTKLIDTKLFDSGPVEAQPVEAHHVEAQAAQSTLPATPVGEASPVENAQVVGDVVDAKTVEPQIIETKIVVTQNSDTTAVEAQTSETAAAETNNIDAKNTSARETETAPRLGRLSRMLLAAGVDLRGERAAPPPASLTAAPAEAKPAEAKTAEAKTAEVAEIAPLQEETTAGTTASQDTGTPEVVTPEAAAKPDAPTEEQSLLTPELQSLPTSSASLRALDSAIAIAAVKAKTGLPAASEKPVAVEERAAEEPAATSVAPVAESLLLTESSPKESIPKESTPEESTPKESTPKELASDAAAIAGENRAAEIASPPEEPSAVPAAVNPAGPHIVPDPPLGGKLPLPGSPAVTAPPAMAPSAPQNLAAEPLTDPQGLIGRAALATQPEKLVKGPVPAQVQMRLAMPVVSSAAVRPAGSVEHEAPVAPANDAAQAPDTPVRQPSPRMGRLVRYSPIVKKMIVPAAPEAGPCRTSVDFGVTVPGPVLPETLLSFKDPGLTPAFIEQAALKKGFNYGLLVLVILIGSGLGFLLANVTHFFQLPEADAEAAVAAAPEAKPETAPQAASASNSLSKSIEVTGFRIVENPAGKMEVQYIVVNHSAVRFPDAKVFVTLYSTDARVGQPPVCQFSFAVPNLGPFEAKEMASNFESAHSANLPEWRSLRANVSIGQ